MAVSPNAPDYVSQVRGFLSDLRQDARQREQLALEAQKANMSNALSYAQLAQQKDLALLEADLNREQYQQAYDQKQMTYENNALKSALQNYDKKTAQDLAERRFQFDVQKQENELDNERRKRLGEAESTYALQKLTDIISTGDPDGYSKWTNDMGKMAFSNANWGALATTGLNLWNSAESARKTKLTAENMPSYISLTDESAKLRVKLPYMTKEDRTMAIADWDKRAADLKLKVENPQLISSLDTISKGIKEEVDSLSKDAKSQDMNSFTALGRRGGLEEIDPDIQKEFTSLYNSTSDTDKETLGYEQKVDDLRLKFNRAKASKELASEAMRMRQYEEIQVGRDGLYTVDADGFRKPKVAAPDLTPSFGNGNLDEDNKMSNIAREKIKRYEAQMGQQGIILEKQSDVQALSEMVVKMEEIRSGKPKGEGKTGPTETKPTAQVDSNRARFSNTWAFPTAVNPTGTATAGPVQTPQAPVPAQTAGNINNLDANRALYAEVQKQIAGGKKYLEVTNPQTGEVKLTTIPLSTLYSNLPILIREQERMLATSPTSPQEGR